MLGKFCTVMLLGVMLLLIAGTVAHAQQGPINPETGFNVRLGTNTYNGQDCSAVQAAGGTGNGVACTMDNGHAPGSFWNTGIFSTSVEQGGETTIDLSQLRKPLTEPFRRGFVLIWSAGGNLILMILAITFAAVYAFNLIAKPGEVE